MHFDLFRRGPRLEKTFYQERLKKVSNFSHSPARRDEQEYLSEDEEEVEEVEEVGLLEMRRRNKNNIISQTLVGFPDLPDPHRPATPAIILPARCLQAALN